MAGMGIMMGMGMRRICISPSGAAQEFEKPKTNLKILFKIYFLSFFLYKIIY